MHFSYFIVVGMENSTTNKDVKSVVLCRVLFGHQCNIGVRIGMMFNEKLVHFLHCNDISLILKYISPL